MKPFFCHEKETIDVTALQFNKEYEPITLSVFPRFPDALASPNLNIFMLLCMSKKACPLLKSEYLLKMRRDLLERCKINILVIPEIR